MRPYICGQKTNGVPVVRNVFSRLAWPTVRCLSNTHEDQGRGLDVAHESQHLIVGETLRRQVL